MWSLPEGADDIYIPALQVRDVYFEEILETLQILMMAPDGKPGFEFVPTGRNTWAFYEKVPQPRMGQDVPIERAPEPELCTFPLNDLLEVYEMPDIVTLITTAWKTGGMAQPENMTVHEETMMLIMKATPEQEAVVDGLLRELAEASETARKLKRDRATYHESMDAKLRSIEMASDQRVQITKQELQRSELRLQELDARHEAELAKLRDINSQLRSDIQELLAKFKSGN